MLGCAARAPLMLIAIIFSEFSFELFLFSFLVLVCICGKKNIGLHILNRSAEWLSFVVRLLRIL